MGVCKKCGGELAKTEEAGGVCYPCESKLLPSEREEIMGVIPGNKDNDLDQATKYLLERYGSIKELKDEFKNVSNLKEVEQENLVVTDLFVEKDIQILSRRSDELKASGNFYFKISISFFIFGTFIAFGQMIHQIVSNNVGPLGWSELLQLTAKPFIAYGLLVLTAVALWKQSKAMLDQAERILEKRRANRVLRMFIYLHKGEIEIDELETILKWGTVDSNAFTAMVAEGKAPMGVLMSDLLAHNNKLMSDIMKRNSSAENKQA